MTEPRTHADHGHHPDSGGDEHESHGRHEPGENSGQGHAGRGDRGDHGDGGDRGGRDHSGHAYGDQAHGDQAHGGHDHGGPVHGGPAQGGHVHGGHVHGGHGATWATAASATLHCLTGCAIGEVLGMVIGTALGWSNLPTVVLAVVLAFFFGYALTLRGLHRAGVGWRKALRLALAADTLSIAVMEIVDNGVMVVIPGAMDSGLASVLFWGALAFSLLVAFVVTTPVNKWVIGRGKGHAVVHAYH